MNNLPLFPAHIVDVVGSSLAIFLSFLALRYARRLVRHQPDNFIWGFIFYFCIAMAIFSLSRGVGHIARILLVFDGNVELWHKLAPFSGGFNTMLMISAAAVTIYYHKGLEAYKAIRSKAEKLEDANIKISASAEQLKQLNTHLEELVEDRARHLSKSERKFRQFFENSKDIIFFCNKDWHLSSINSSGWRLLDIEDPIEDISLCGLFIKKDDRKLYLRELMTHGYVSDLEIECRGRNNSTKHILFSANTVYDEYGKVIGYEGIGKDVTRLKTITEQLINREKMASVGEMAAGVAHEINTPLGIILGYTQLMMDDYKKGSEAHTNLEVMERQTKACRRIVADLLKFSRQSESKKISLNINQVIEEVLAVTEHTLNIQQVAVIRKFDLQLPQIIGDTEKLRQVIINLFNNAQFAMGDKGGTITVLTTFIGESVKISVIDTGTGIPDDIKKKIFAPFFTTKSVGKGTGLGLSVIYGIIQEHGGQISVESPVTDQKTGEKISGTAFHIWLPLESNHKGNNKE